MENLGGATQEVSVAIEKNITRETTHSKRDMLKNELDAHVN